MDNTSITIRGSYKFNNPKETAYKASIILAGDRGIPNKIICERKNAYLVICDDGNAVRYYK